MLNTLYKRNVNGKINQWSVKYDENGYWTEFGQVGGVITKSEKVIVEAKNIGKKNETTIQEQAIKEATSAWKKKIKSENFVENINDVDKKAFNPPMLAHKYEGEYSDDIKFIQPKLDGIRCNMHFENGEVIALSRKNNPFYTVDHIKKSIHKILEENPSIHLDGELYNHELHDDFNKVVSLVKKEKLKEDDIKEVVKYVRYNIYDMWDDNNSNLTFGERFEIIFKLFKNIEFIDIVPTYHVHNRFEVDKFFKEFIKNGFEGAILRKNEPYEHKRSKNLLKYKEFMDDEFEVLDIFEGKAKNGIAEYAWISLGDGNACKATLAFTDEECGEIYKNKNKYIGKEATVRFFGYTNDKKLRFPVLKAFRDYE
jgi:DNA ligase-1